MNPLRILHITHSLNVGGLERVVVDLAKGFKKRGHFVEICCLDGKEPMGEEAEKAGIKVFSLNKKPGITWGLPFRIAEIMKEEQINLVHTHNEAGLLYGVPAALKAQVTNIVHTEHGKEPGYENKKALKLAEKFLLKKVKHVVAVSKDMKDKLVTSSGINNDTVSVIHNGIDADNFYQPEHREAMRNALGIEHDDFVIGNIARMVPLKNHRFLITVFKELLKDLPNLKLVLVGDGLLSEELKTYSRDIGLSDSLLFLGERHDIAQLFSVFDLFVLPSLTEGTSMTIIEAMASGTPVVASKVGGNPEIIENGQKGLLIPLDNILTWANAIKFIIENDIKRKEISKFAKNMVKERFSLRSMVDNYEKVYKD